MASSPWDPGEMSLPSSGIPYQAFRDGDQSPGLSPACCGSCLLLIIGKREEHPAVVGAAGGTPPVGASTWWHPRPRGMCRALAVVRRCHMDSIN